MTETYFSNFPTITYNGKQCLDITRRAKIAANNSSSPFVYYPYEIPHELRADHIASYYYDDGYLDWLVYLTNNIIDPYYDWYLSNEEFNDLMRQKYGSIENSQRKVIYYQNNWEQDSVEITPSFYNNTLPNSHKKYYTPVFGVNTKIVSYKRKQDDSVTNTNRILQFEISNNSTVGFTAGEAVTFRASGSDTNLGNGEVEMANSSILRVRSVAGNTEANTTVTKDIVGVDSGANVNATSVEIFFENFSNSEAVFWSAVNYYEYEEFINEQKKNIQLPGDTIHSLLVDEFRESINGTNNTTV